MQLSLFLSLLLFSVAASARTSLRDSCGAGTIISERTLARGDHDIKITTTSCPGFSALKNASAPSTSKRQSIIADFCSAIQCQPTFEQPLVADCNTLTADLISLGTEEFLAPSETLTTFEVLTCVYGFANFDSIAYDVLFANVGETGQESATQCLKDFATPGILASFCESPEVPGDDWVIEVIHS